MAATYNVPNVRSPTYEPTTLSSYGPSAAQRRTSRRCRIVTIFPPLRVTVRVWRPCSRPLCNLGGQVRYLYQLPEGDELAYGLGCDQFAAYLMHNGSEVIPALSW